MRGFGLRNCSLLPKTNANKCWVGRVKAVGSNGVRDNNVVLESMCWVIFMVVVFLFLCVGMVRALIVANGYCIGREKGIGAGDGHCRRELSHERFCLQVQITHHVITMPAAQHVNGVVVDATAEEGHSAPRTKVPSTDIARMQASLM
jgi:hypothetical protein